MLSMAYGSDQRGVLQAHRPEICYVAQGFKLETLNDGVLSTSSGDISVRRLTTSMGPRNEPVTYWLTMADNVVRNDFDGGWCSTSAPDWPIERASVPGVVIDRNQRCFQVQQQFAADMMATVP
jgi:hypothetical protein